MRSSILSSVLCLASLGQCHPTANVTEDAAAPAKWAVSFYSDLGCGNLIGAAGSASAVRCTPVGGGGAESYDWASGGGRWGLRLYPQTGCGGSLKAVTADTDCDNAGFKIQSYEVIGRR